jgi:hypothetical protein
MGEWLPLYIAAGAVGGIIAVRRGNLPHAAWPHCGTSWSPVTPCHSQAIVVAIIVLVIRGRRWKAEQRAWLQEVHHQPATPGQPSPCSTTPANHPDTIQNHHGGSQVIGAADDTPWLAGNQLNPQANGSPFRTSRATGDAGTLHILPTSHKQPAAVWASADQSSADRPSGGTQGSFSHGASEEALKRAVAAALAPIARGSAAVPARAPNSGAASPSRRNTDTAVIPQLSTALSGAQGPASPGLLARLSRRKLAAAQPAGASPLSSGGGAAHAGPSAQASGDDARLGARRSGDALASGDDYGALPSGARRGRSITEVALASPRGSVVAGRDARAVTVAGLQLHANTAYDLPVDAGDGGDGHQRRPGAEPQDAGAPPRGVLEAQPSMGHRLAAFFGRSKKDLGASASASAPAPTPAQQQEPALSTRPSGSLPATQPAGPPASAAVPEQAGPPASAAVPEQAGATPSCLRGGTRQDSGDRVVQTPVRGARVKFSGAVEKEDEPTSSQRVVVRSRTSNLGSSLRQAAGDDEEASGSGRSFGGNKWLSMRPTERTASVEAGADPLPRRLTYSGEAVDAQEQAAQRKFGAAPPGAAPPAQKPSQPAPQRSTGWGDA